MVRVIAKRRKPRCAWIVALLCLICLALPVVAQAQAWTAQSHGEVLPVWLEQMAAVNDTGDVAWPALVADPANPTKPSIEARLWTDGETVPLHHIGRPAGFALSFASDLTASRRVAGYFADDFGEGQRAARLWFSSVRGWHAIDLHKALPEGWAQSAALSVTEGERSSSIVAGMSRKQRDAAHLPQPTVWEVVQGKAYLRYLEMGDFDHGIARAIARTPDGTSTFACGAIGQSRQAYNIAACWDLEDGGRLLLPDFAAWSDHLTSTWARTRAIEVAPGVQHVFVGGTVFFTDGSSRAVLQNLNTGETIFPLELNADASTLFGDVSGYFPEQLFTDERDYGLRIFGLSTTLAPVKEELKPYTQPQLSTSPLRAVQSHLLPGESSGAPVPMVEQRGLHAVGLIDRDLVGASMSIDYAFGASPNGEYLLSYVQGRLYRLARTVQPAVRATLYARNLQTRTSRWQTSAYAEHSNATKIAYHWFTLEGIGGTPEQVTLVWGDAPDFAGVTRQSSAGCAIPSGLAAQAVRELELIRSEGGTHHSVRFDLPADLATPRYLRVLYALEGVCHASPVHVSEAPLFNTPLSKEAFNPYDAGRKWGYCYASAQPGSAFDTDLHRSLDHCGSCGSSCTRPNMHSTCADGICQIGGCDIGWADLNGDLSDGCEHWLGQNAVD